MAISYHTLTSYLKNWTESNKKLIFIFDNRNVGNYNVSTMLTTIISIGNSRGVRIPKPLLDESGLRDKVEMKVKKGEIRIVPAVTLSKPTEDTTLLSEKALSDWNRKEENEAWKDLQ